MDPAVAVLETTVSCPSRRDKSYHARDLNPARADPFQSSLVTTQAVHGESDPTYHLVGLVGKASASKPEDPEFDSRLRRDFSRSSHTSDFKIGTPVATLPGDGHYRVSAGTGRPSVRIL